MAFRFVTAPVFRPSKRLFPLRYLVKHRSTPVAAMSMKELEQNEFWQKKLRRAVTSRDANKDGSITRKDFELIVDRYRRATESKTVDSLAKTFQSFCDGLGLTDYTASFSYEEFEKRWKKLMLTNPHEEMWQEMFKCLDFNGNGVIDLNEWKIHNAAMGIRPEHAEESFKAMDTDSDGSVTESEFVAYHHEFFLTTDNKLNSAILYGPY